MNDHAPDPTEALMHHLSLVERASRSAREGLAYSIDLQARAMSASAIATAPNEPSERQKVEHAARGEMGRALSHLFEYCRFAQDGARAAMALLEQHGVVQKVTEQKVVVE